MDQRSENKETKVLVRRVKRKNAFSRGERGATMIEYSLVAAIMVTGLITGIFVLRQNMSLAFSQAGSAVNSQ